MVAGFGGMRSNWGMGRPSNPGQGNGSPRTEGRDAAYFTENGQRRSRRAEEATQTAQTLLASCERELQHERDGKKRLARENTRTKTKFESIKLECENLKKKKRYLGDRYEYVVDNALRPYAKSRDIVFSDTDATSIDATVGPMYKDASEAQYLRVQVRRLQATIPTTETLKDRLRNQQKLENELKTLREQVQVLHKENQGLRTQPQASQQEREEISDLREQVQTLQRDSLTKVDEVRAVPDSQFAQDFRAIVGLVKSLSRSIRLPEDTVLFAVLDAGILLTDVPAHRWNTRAQKKCFIEAWVWSVLVENIFLTPFTIFNRDGDSVSALWSKMFDVQHSRDWPTPSLRCESWRVSTMEQLMEAAGRGVITHGEERESSQPPEDVDRDIQKSVIRSRALVRDIIQSKLSALSPSIDLPHVQNIVDKAFTLALEMSLQRSRLRVTFPTVGTNFNTDRMTPIPDRGGRDIEEGTVAFIANPGLAKWGDAEGRNMGCRYDIVVSLVQIEASGGNETAPNQDKSIFIKVEQVKIKPEPEG